MPWLLALALRNVRRNRRRTLLSLAAIATGVCAMVAYRGFTNGQQALFRDGVIEGQLGAIQIHRRGYLARADQLPLDLSFEDSPALRARILLAGGVAAIAPRLVFGAMLSTPEPAERAGRTSFLVATGLETRAERHVSPRRLGWIVQGALPADPAAPVLVATEELAAALALRPVEVLPPEAERPALLAYDRDGALNAEALALSGTLAAGLPGDRKTALVPLAVAQRLLRMEGRVTEYALAVTDAARAKEIRDRIAAELGPEFELHTWDELMPFIRGVVDNMNLVFGVAAGVLLLVVLLGIANAMLMNVLERVREIGTMLAVGMRRGHVLAAFLCEGAVLGLAGGALGALAGWGTTALLQSTGVPIPVPGAALPATVRPFVATSFLWLALAAAALVAALAALGPALHASRLRPVEALRHR